MNFRHFISAVFVWVLGAWAAFADPIISGFSPVSGAPGRQVTITGANFIFGTTSVQFGNTFANVTLLQNNQLIATVPVGAETGVITVYNDGGFVSSVANFTVAPRIDDFTPASAAIGGQVLITGANFIPGGTTIKFGAANAVISVTATTQIFATVPAGASTGPITVATFAGTNASATNFIVLGTGPVITDFTPSLASTGAVVVINGGDFTTVTNVAFNHANTTNFFVTAPTQLHVVVPTNATTGLISVQTPTGTGTSSSNFVVAGLLPIVTDFSPFSAKAGAPVVINGLNFTLVTNVTFNGSNAIFNVTADTQIIALVPTNIATGPIQIANFAGRVTTTSNFIIGPFITDFAPSSSAAGSIVVINGFNFLEATNVSFNGANAIFVVTADTQLQVVVPTNATSGPIIVTASTGTNVTSSNFVVTANAPVITGFTPTNGLIGATVVISGVNFLGVTNVTFNGTNAAFNVTADTQISATVPIGATTGAIKVSNSGGSATTTNLFFLPPQLINFAPTNGTVGTVITVTGTNFVGVTIVSFAGTNATRVAASFTNISPTQLAVVVPTNAVTGTLTVTAPGGVIISTNNFFVPPRVDSFTPTLGPVGTVVTVDGLNFIGATSVGFNGTSATFTTNSDMQLSAIVPSGATSGPISVTAPGGTAVSAGIFTVTEASDLLVTQTFSPSVVIVGQTMTSVITVSNQGPSIVTSVVITDTLPPGSTFVLASSSQGACGQTNGVVTCNLGTISNGFTATVLLVTRPNVPGFNENRAQATALEGVLNGFHSLSSVYAPVITDQQRTMDIRLLSATRQTVLSWPFSAVNFQVQFNTNLVSLGNVWFDLTNPIVLVTNQSVIENRVTNGLSGPRTFYRLKGP